MAVKEIKRVNNGLGEFLREFICDEVVDLSNMQLQEDGIAVGSTVLCLEDKKKYILSVGNTWEDIEENNALGDIDETDPIFTAWNKSTGISITKSQISDFAHNHDDRYYTETEIDTMIGNIESALNAILGV